MSDSSIPESLPRPNSQLQESCGSGSVAKLGGPKLKVFNPDGMMPRSREELLEAALNNPVSMLRVHNPDNFCFDEGFGWYEEEAEETESSSSLAS